MDRPSGSKKYEELGSVKKRGTIGISIPKLITSAITVKNNVLRVLELSIICIDLVID
ncbi:hypothetical protein HBNXNv_0573 [Candidatus Nanohalovita haloferacivicina]|nr:hypothetical protein HBNXNv_0573 [Candidatus Nanohalobia archaeon BNXNv]